MKLAALRWQDKLRRDLYQGNRGERKRNGHLNHSRRIIEADINRLALITHNSLKVPKGKTLKRYKLE